MFKIKYLKLAFLSVFLLTHTMAMAAVKAYLNQDEYYEGDPVTITVETNINNNARPNLSVLEKSFEILGTSNSSQINIINGRRSFKRSWTIELQPKVNGKVQIPAIPIGNDKTEALEITITSLPPEVKAETSKHIFIESYIDSKNDETYVQQQIPYTVKLYYDAAMVSGDISSLNIKNAVTEQLGEDRRYRITRGDKQFNVVEKHFVISPEKSGKLEIPATTVKGRIALSGGDSPKLRRRMDETDMLNRFFNDPFFNDSFGGGFFSRRSQGPSKPFTASSEAIEVNVLPVPDAFTGATWLPAEDLLIKDSWAKQPPDLKVGEPVTRTLVLQAKGLAGSQIPEIDIPKTKGIKIYPEKAKSVTRTDGKTVYGIQTINITYIPDKKGKITIPEIKVAWWNIKTKKQEIFTLPKWNLNIAAGVDAVVPEYETAALEGDKKADENTKKDENEAKDLAVTKSSWKTLLALALLMLVLGTAIYAILKKWNKTVLPDAKNSSKKSPSSAAIRSTLLKACDANNKQGAANLLIQFVQADWHQNDIQNLGSLAAKLDSGEEVITELEQSLYAPDNANWNGKKLRVLLENGLQAKKAKATSQKYHGLKPLYPQ